MAIKVRHLFYCTIIGLLAVALSACADLPPMGVEDAAEPAASVEDGTDPSVASGQAGDQTMGVAGANALLMRANSLIGYDFTNLDGEIAGSVESVVLDTATGQILYLLLEYGGFLELGDTELAVPLSAFAWGANDELILNFDEEQLASLPALENGWLDTSDPAWDDELAGFWRDAGFASWAEYSASTDTVVRAEEMIGYSVGDVGLGIGNIEDLMIDLGRSEIAYVFVAYDAGVFEEEIVVVPFAAFDTELLTNEFVFHTGIDATTLEQAPRFDREALQGAELAPSMQLVESYWSRIDFGGALGPGRNKTSLGVAAQPVLPAGPPSPLSFNQVAS